MGAAYGAFAHGCSHCGKGWETENRECIPKNHEFAGCVSLDALQGTAESTFFMDDAAS